MKFIKLFTLFALCLVLFGCVMTQDDEKTLLKFENGKLINPSLEDDAKQQEAFEEKDPDEEPEPLELDDSVRQFNKKEMSLREFPEREFQDKEFNGREMPDRELSDKELSTREMPE